MEYLTETLFVLTTFLIIIINYIQHSFKYWEKRNVPQLKPRFPMGNNRIAFPKSFNLGTTTKDFYDELKKQGHKFGGIYLTVSPNLVLVDPEYIKDVMSKDFQYFVDRGFFHNPKSDPTSSHLFSVDSDKWKNLRVKLTPTFTSGKMKMMFHSVAECCGYMKDYVDQNLETDLDMKELCGRFTTDVIGICAFGITCNSFKFPNAEFRKMGKRIFESTLFSRARSLTILYFPKLAKKIGIAPTKPDVQNFFKMIVHDTVKIREENGIKRNDFLQLLIDMKNTIGFSMEEIVAQVVLFFIAGFDTSSTAMSFGLYKLAQNPDIQTKVRQEVNEVLARFDGKITYESLFEMKYLDQVLDETLRMFPPLTTLTRRCTKDYNLRDTDIIIEKGTPVLISTLGLHMDPEYFPNPEVFDPERFSEENKKNIRSFTYIPFGDGPRNCIGLRFGVMQSKIGIATIIKNFNLTVSPGAKPIELDPYTFLLKSVDTLKLRATKV